MRPSIKENDVQNLTGHVTVCDLHNDFYEGFINSREALKSLPDWLEDEDEDEYEERRITHEYDTYVQGEMAAWLSQVDEKTVHAETVQEKYMEFKTEAINKFDLDADSTPTPVEW